METRQAEHLKLTEEEIKEIVCELTSQLHETKDFVKELIDYMEDIESKIERLKRHFCPEKFQIMSMPMSTLTELMEKAYIDPSAGPVRRMAKLEVKDDELPY